MTIRMSQEEKKFLEKAIAKMVTEASKAELSKLERKVNMLTANLVNETRKAAVLATRNARLEKKVRVMEAGQRQLNETLNRRSRQ